MSERATVDTASPLTVVLDSSERAIPAVALASYTPVLADRVAVDVLNGQCLVLGKVTP